MAGPLPLLREGVMNEFYMNSCDAGGTSTKRMFSLDDARAEAQRLCIKEGRRVHILKSIEAYEPPPAIARNDYKPAPAE